MLNPDTPAKCCSYCGGRDHDFEECPKRKADAEKEKVARGPEPTVLQRAELGLNKTAGAA